MIALNNQLNILGQDIVQLENEAEHSLEIQLPFLQTIWKENFKLMPVMIRAHDCKKLKNFSKALFNTIKDKDCLIIASSDLSHFNPLNIAQSLDSETLQRIKHFNPEGVLSGAADNSAPACGAGAIAAMLYTLKMMGADKGTNTQLQHFGGFHRRYKLCGRLWFSRRDADCIRLS